VFCLVSFTFFLEILQIYRIEIKTQRGDFGFLRGFWMRIPGKFLEDFWIPGIPGSLTLSTFVLVDFSGGVGDDEQSAKGEQGYGSLNCAHHLVARANLATEPKEFRREMSSRARAGCSSMTRR
jgi:hypothetical protein